MNLQMDLLQIFELPNFYPSRRTDNMARVVSLPASKEQWWLVDCSQLTVDECQPSQGQQELERHAGDISGSATDARQEKMIDVMLK